MEKTEQPNANLVDSWLRVTFAPDFRELGPYQWLLGDSLAAWKTKVDYLTGYRRGMPLSRGLKDMPMDILHLHYPVYYFERYNKWNVPRKLRFPIDLHLGLKGRPLVYTVHDLYPLDEQETFLNRIANESALKCASALIVHSVPLKKLVESKFGRHGEKCFVIPHGDLSLAYGPPLPRKVAREKLGLGNEKICLMFGRLTANKGVEEFVEFWKRGRPEALLAVVGSLKDPGYGRALKELTGDVQKIFMKFGFQSDEQLRLWFSAADCVAINYGKIYTSGVASLARSYGLPVLVPNRHTTVDLQEPHPSVFRFDTVETDFGEKLEAALHYTPSYNAAEGWRKTIAWDVIAEQTRKVYEHVMA